MQYDALVQVTKLKLQKSCARLEQAYRKCQSLPLQPDMDDLTLEAFEGLTARFARTADLFLNRYLRVAILDQDPAFRGTFKDMLNQAEKQGLIQDVAVWMGIRELRNRIAYEYEEDGLSDLFAAVLAEAPRLLGVVRL